MVVITSRMHSVFVRSKRKADVGTGHIGTDIGITGHSENILACAEHSLRRHKNVKKCRKKDKNMVVFFTEGVMS